MFWDNFYSLCLIVGKAPNTVAKEIGISSGIVTKWKKGISFPRESTLNALADYFGVTADELLRDGPTGGSETAEEEPVPTEKSSDPLALVGELFALIDKMDDKQAEQMSEYLAFLLEKRKKK